MLIPKLLEIGQHRKKFNIIGLHKKKGRFLRETDEIERNLSYFPLVKSYSSKIVILKRINKGNIKTQVG